MKTRYYTTIRELEMNVRRYIEQEHRQGKYVPQGYRNILMFLENRNYGKIKQAFGDGGTCILLGIQEHEKVDIEELQISDFLKEELVTVMILCKREIN